jgi:hypothetical protein
MGGVGKSFPTVVGCGMATRFKGFADLLKTGVMAGGGVAMHLLVSKG